ncbi:Uncharacterised protein [uncultured archaeon]|nr:Uncharacterised protein [uncultured archaeon]
MSLRAVDKKGEGRLYSLNVRGRRKESAKYPSNMALLVFAMVISAVVFSVLLFLAGSLHRGTTPVPSLPEVHLPAETSPNATVQPEIVKPKTPLKVPQITDADKELMLKEIDVARESKSGFLIAQTHYYLQALGIQTNVTEKDEQLMANTLNEYRTSYPYGTANMFFYMKQLGLNLAVTGQDKAFMYGGLEDLRTRASVAVAAEMNYWMRSMGMQTEFAASDKTRMRDELDRIRLSLNEGDAGSCVELALYGIPITNITGDKIKETDVQSEIECETPLLDSARESNKSQLLLQTHYRLRALPAD